MPEEKFTKSYVRPDKTAVITCPYCGRQKQINVTTLKEHKATFKIKCACQNIFTAHIEFRQRVRKNTYLKGTYTNLTQKSVRGEITVRNLSVSGLEFATYDMNNFNVNDEILVEFILDDDRRTEISREAVVKHVRKSTIGCEFSESGNIALDGPLGTYLNKI